jgi:hypothetical protein
MEAKVKEMSIWQSFRYMNYADEQIQEEEKVGMGMGLEASSD